MVDVDRRSSLTPSHAAGLRRLSTRAASSTTAPSSTPTPSLHSFLPFASSLTSQLRSSHIPTLPGLSPSELAHIEAHFNFTFPPDLRALLSLSLPSFPGFAPWRSLPSLVPSFHLPIAAVSLQISRSAFWPKSWGPKPPDPTTALRHARSSLKRAPLLIPICHRCYIPSLPCIAGNPVFFVDDDQISLCGFDLADFFSRFLRSPQLVCKRSNSLPRGVDSMRTKNPRWIEFWSDAAACDRKRRSSSSTSDPERFVEIRMAKQVPEWLRSYLDRIGAVLKDGGWGESDVSEMVEVTSSKEEGGEFAVVDEQAALDSLLLRADRCSDSLRRAGWSAEEVAEALGFEVRLRRRKEVRLPEVIRVKIGKLAEAVSKS